MSRQRTDIGLALHWSPTRSALTPATNLSVNWSATASSTMKRLAAMQLWPLFWLRARTAVAAAASRSASARTMNGSEPPSSSTCFFRYRPAVLATCSPTSLEPVRVTAWMRGSAMSRSTLEPGTSKCTKQALRQSGRFEDLLDGQRTAWHI